MDNPVLRFSAGVVGAVLATLIAATILQEMGNIGARWVILGCLAMFIFAFLIYGAFQGFGRPPYKKWWVTNFRDHNGLLIGGGAVNAHQVSSSRAYQFQASSHDFAVFGPYLQSPLKKGRYSARYKIKLDGRSGDPDTHIVRLSVASKGPDDGAKTLADRTLTNRDFAEDGVFLAFPIDFAVYAATGEEHLEFRIQSCGNDGLITLDYVELSRRLL